MFRIPPEGGKEFRGQALAFRPLTREEWVDFARLFEEEGVQNGCWCMYWRATRAACQRGYGEGNKLAMKTIVDSGIIPGILAYLGGQAVAWCSVGPREDFPVLQRSRTLKPVDTLPVWCITCFFVSKPYRRQGITEVLIQAAVRFAAQGGAAVVEAYPLRSEITKRLPYERYMGIQSTFERLGFVEVTARSERRPIMRYRIRSMREK